MVFELTNLRKAYGPKVVLGDISLHIERGDRIALVGHNGAGKSTLMRMLSAEEAPDRGRRSEGHQVVMQYFAQDEAARLEPSLTVYETLSSGSPDAMIPAIRNILGGFLFSGDDVYKKVAVLSGGERTRLAVARMLLRPSNTLLLDEPTNHLDLDSKEVLLEALADYGGTLIFVSHDRYFVERLATRIVEVGDGRAILYPGTYTEYLWSKANGGASASARPKNGSELRRDRAGAASARGAAAALSARSLPDQKEVKSYEAQKRESADRKKRERALKNLRDRISDLEARIAEHEQSIKDLEATMSAPGFFEAHAEAKPVIDRHQALMWEVGELLNQWEMLQGESEEYADLKS
jgi:ATP-binding cassette subfamily F protein 3